MVTLLHVYFTTKQYNSIIEMDIFANFSHHHSNFKNTIYNLYNGNFRTKKKSRHGFNCYTAVKHRCHSLESKLPVYCVPEYAPQLLLHRQRR